jgi:hypothetical protein
MYTSTADIDADNHGLAAEFLGGFGDQVRGFQGGRVDGNLVGAGVK